MRYPLRAALAAVLALAASACGDSPSGSDPSALTLRTRGALMRDSVVHVTAVYEGDIVAPAGAVTLTADPSDAIQLLGGDSLRLLRSGTVKLSGSYDRYAGSVVLEVAAPAALVVEAAAGRVERSSVVHLRVLRAGAAIPAAQVAFTFTPADGAQALGGDSVKLLRAGTVTVRATSGRDEGTRDLLVATPPAIVFDRVVGTNRDVWRVDLDGGGLARLTDDAADDSDPTVAAGRIVFVSLRADANSELFSIPLAGGAATRLTRTASNEGMPALSPDGRRLAYTSDASGIGKLWLASADGTGAARASSLGGDFAIDASPSWAPGSARLAFSSSADGTPDIYSFTPPAAPIVVAGGSGNDVDPAFSPDGQFVAFASTRGGAGATSLYLLAVSSGVVTRLTMATLSQGQPAWTADGRLVFTEFAANGGQLRWLDPAAPSILHTIDTGAGSARNPAGVP